jgi:hypothetical protein
MGQENGINLNNFSGDQRAGDLLSVPCPKDLSLGFVVEKERFFGLSHGNYIRL